MVTSTATRQSVFSAQDVADAQALILDWARSFPDAAQNLSGLWAAYIMKAGHKTMGRALLHLPADELESAGRCL